jgi:hypothetical protein
MVLCAPRTAKAFPWQVDSLHESGAVPAGRDDELRDADRVRAVPTELLPVSVGCSNRRQRHALGGD